MRRTSPTSRRVPEWLRDVPFYPLLLGVYPVLALAEHNQARVSLLSFLAIVLAALGAAAAAFLVARRLLGSAEHGAAAVLLAEGIFWGFGHAEALFPELHFGVATLRLDPGGMGLGTVFVNVKPEQYVAVGERLFAWDAFFTGVWILGSLACAALLWRNRHRISWPTATPWLNLSAVFLVGLSAAILAWKGVSGFEPMWTGAADAVTGGTAELLAQASPPAPLPDIYFIVPDRYARSDVLRTVYGFDNSDFLSALADRGFFVAPSAAHYPTTMTELPAVLNLTYLDSLVARLPSGTSGSPALTRALAENRTARILRGFGYWYVHAGSWFEGTARSPQADRVVLGECGSTHSFGDLVVETTLLRLGREPWTRHVATTPEACRGLSRADSRRIRVKFEALEEVARDPVPTFTFVHFLFPHSPAVVDARGRDLTIGDRRERTGMELYIGQVRYFNQRILEVIDTIRARSSVPPVIILQADTGPISYQAGGLLPSLPDTAIAGMSHPQKKMMFGILNAYLVPGADSAALAAMEQPVNTFRVLLDHYFGLPLPPLPGRHYEYRGEALEEYRPLSPDFVRFQDPD